MVNILLSYIAESNHFKVELSGLGNNLYVWGECMQPIVHAKLYDSYFNNKNNPNFVNDNF